MKSSIALTPIHLASKRIIFSTFLFTYLILFVTLFFTCGIHNMLAGEKIGCYVIIGFMSVIIGL
jgi:hypothetical protein